MYRVLGNILSALDAKVKVKVKKIFCLLFEWPLKTCSSEHQELHTFY